MSCTRIPLRYPAAWPRTTPNRFGRSGRYSMPSERPPVDLGADAGLEDRRRDLRVVQPPSKAQRICPRCMGGGLAWRGRSTPHLEVPLLRRSGPAARDAGAFRRARCRARTHRLRRPFQRRRVFPGVPGSRPHARRLARTRCSTTTLSRRPLQRRAGCWSSPRRARPDTMSALSLRHVASRAHRVRPGGFSWLMQLISRK